MIIYSAGQGLIIRVICIFSETEVARSAVVTCSALKKSYRQILLHGTPVTAGPSVSSGVSGNSETYHTDLLSYKKENDTPSITNKDNVIGGSLEQNRNREMNMCMKTCQCVNTTLSTHSVVFVLLQASLSVLEKRMSNRQGHFMPSSLLTSQIKTLEIPNEVENSLIVDVDKPVEDIINEITDCLSLDINITDTGNT